LGVGGTTKWWKGEAAVSADSETFVREALIQSLKTQK
jgi:hypothetical protein